MRESIHIMREESDNSNLVKGISLIILLIPLFVSSCSDQRMQTVTWTEYEPVYMSHAEFTSAVKMKKAREIREPGKIYFYNDYLFVNEVDKGVHIIDNTDPASPAIVGFINIPANKDIAVKDDRLYADSHSDLLVFDITNMQEAELITRKEDVFEFSAAMHPGFPYQEVDNSQGIVVDWKPVQVETVCEGDCFPVYAQNGFLNMEASGGLQTGSSDAGGRGGSMARFAITGDYLYAVDYKNLLSFEITSPEPSLTSEKDVGWAIETIFPYGDHLYIGSASAMYIFDITNPAVPAPMSIYSHLTACDPVVVEGHFAYVTLRTGGGCPRGANRLEVIDVKDPTNPKEVAFYEMINPHGLGIDDGRLFISEGDKGLKIMDAEDPYDIKQLRHIKEIKTFDVIPFNNVLMVTGQSGIVQYDYSDIYNVKHLSTIPVEGE